jgi:uncharacterized membrane protein YecN with MAPEG domain|tara:strand:+ start:39 stop:419 length:381 start_codon:yes stop_codon:yes gene_type:complete
MCNYLYLVTAILLFVFIALSINAAFTRRKSGLAVGEADNENLLRAVRAHGNFVEYTPMFLISLFLIDHVSKNCEYILVIGSGFVLGRISHATSMFLKKGILRITGMFLTFTPLLSNFVYLIINLIK